MFVYIYMFYFKFVTELFYEGLTWKGFTYEKSFEICVCYKTHTHPPPLISVTTEFGRPEMSLRGWQDLNIQLLTHWPDAIYGIKTGALWSDNGWVHDAI